MKGRRQRISKRLMFTALIQRISLKGAVKSLWKISHNMMFYVFALLCCSLEVIVFYIRQKVFRNKLPNYHIVDGLQLYRGGQPSIAGLKRLGEKGVKTIINLRTGDFNRKAIEAYHRDKIRSVHLPFYPYNPHDKLMIEFLSIIANPNYQPVYVHCFHGADRTGTVCALYRIVVQNWDKEDAILEMESNGLHWWQRHLIDYIRNLDVESIRAKIKKKQHQPSKA